MRIGSCARSHRRGTFAVLCAFLPTSGITCTAQQAQAKGPQFDAPFLDHRQRNVEQWAAEDQQIDQKLAALREPFGKRGGSR